MAEKQRKFGQKTKEARIKNRIRYEVREALKVQREENIGVELGTSMICKNCGTVFSKNSPNQAYCNEDCRKEFWAKKGKYSKKVTEWLKAHRKPFGGAFTDLKMIPMCHLHNFGLCDEIVISTKGESKDLKGNTVEIVRYHKFCRKHSDQMQNSSSFRTYVRDLEIEEIVEARYELEKAD